VDRESGHASEHSSSKTLHAIEHSAQSSIPQKTGYVRQVGNSFGLRRPIRFVEVKFILFEGLAGVVLFNSVDVQFNPL